MLHQNIILFFIIIYIWFLFHTSPLSTIFILFLNLIAFPTPLRSSNFIFLFSPVIFIIYLRRTFWWIDYILSFRTDISTACKRSWNDLFRGRRCSFFCFVSIWVSNDWLLLLWSNFSKLHCPLSIYLSINPSVISYFFIFVAS